MSSLPLLVVPAWSDGDDVRRVLESWSAMGLLAPFVWARSEAGPQPGRKVECVEGGVSSPADLFEVVASQPFSVVRLVTLALHSPAEQEEYAIGAERVADLLAEVLAPSQRLVRLNLLVPASGAPPMTESMLLVGWNANVVVSSEDRISPAHADRLVGADGGYAEHAALACSMVAGLWTAMAGKGPLDDVALSHAQGHSNVVVVRSFGRLVRAPGVLDEVLAALYASRGTAAWAAAAAGGSPARDPALVVDRSVTWLLQADGAALNHRPAAPLRAPTLARPGLFATLRAMVRHIGGRQARLSLPAGRGDSVQMAQAATKLVDAERAAREAGEGAPTPHEDAAAAAGRIAAKLLEDVGSPVSPPSSAPLWSTLRQTCFGLLDGGDLPVGLDPPMDGATREVVVDVTFVAPPLDVLRLGMGGDLAVEEPGPEEDRGDSWRAGVRACDPLQAALVRASTLEAVAAARGAGDEELVARHEAALHVLDGWVDGRRAALLWRVAEHLSAQADKARGAFLAAVRVVAKGQQEGDPTAGNRARWRLRLWWAAVALPAVYSIYGAVELNSAFAEPFATAKQIVVVVLLWFAGWFLAFFNYHRTVAVLEYDQARKLHSYLSAVRHAEHEAHETVRLASTYEQLRDWADIVGWLVHRPEGQVPPPVKGSVEEVRHPAALRLATGEADTETLARTAARVGRQVFARGWLQGLYASRSTASMHALKLRGGGDPEDLDPDPDRELSHPPPRHTLLTDIRAGRHAESWRAGVRRQGAETIAALPPGDVVPTVQEGPLLPAPAPSAPAQPTGAYLSAILPGGDGGSSGWFSTSLWTPQSRIAGAGEVTECCTWQPESLGATAALPGITRATNPVRETADLQLLTLRVDISRSHPHEDLHLFDDVAHAEPERASSPMDDGEIG